MDGPRRWGLLTYRTENAGDDVQSAAARRFLPRVDLAVDRERLASAPAAAAILAGWYCHDPDACWPPSPALTPLPASVHVAAHARPHFARPESVAYLRRHGPVGARDLATLRFLRDLGVPAYLSRCLTLTLPRYDGPRGEAVRLVDAPGDLQLPAGLRDRAVRATHVLPAAVRADPAGRLRRAEALLAGLRTARLVVTTRLHAALPAAAFGTPAVLLVPPGDGLREDRAAGLEGCLTLWDEARARAGEWPFDLADPPPPPDVSDAAAELAARCRAFAAGG